MLKNNLHVYGEKKVLLPANLNFGQYMFEKFLTYNNRTALINAETDEELSYRELAQWTADISLALVARGVCRGETVAVCSEERTEYVPTVMGVICAGACFTYIDSNGEASIQHRLNLVKPKLMFCSETVYQRYSEVFKSVGSIEQYIVFGETAIEDDEVTLFKDFVTGHVDLEEYLPADVDGARDHALMMHSSGTTGLSKGVPLTHHQMLVTVINFTDESFCNGRTTLTYDRFFTQTLSYLHGGATTVFVPKYVEKNIFAAIQKYKVEIMLIMPCMLLQLVKHTSIDQYDMSSVVRIVATSSPLGGDLVTAVKNRFPSLREVCQVYGSSEIGVVCSDETAPRGIKPGSVGTARPETVFKVVDINTRQPLGPYQRGEICVKCPSCMTAYLGDTTLSHMDEEGFFKTGDEGYYDEDRYFYIVDRIKDMIKLLGCSVLTALNFFAKGCYQSSIGNHKNAKVSQGTVSNCISEVVDALNHPSIFGQWVNFPKNLAEMMRISQQFNERYGLPGVVGCIDCTHVAIHPPPNNDQYQESIYVNRKGYHSINTQLIAPAELEAVLQKHPAVREAGVVGGPHQVYGEAPTAFVVLQPGAEVKENELTEFVNSQVAHRMRLAGGVHFIEELPRGVRQKIDRKALRRTLEDKMPPVSAPF